MSTLRARSYMKGGIFLGILGLLIGRVSPGSGQVIENVDGVRLVHNVRGGLWWKTPQVVLEQMAQR